MRVLTLAAVLALLGLILFSANSEAASFPNRLQLLKRPHQLIGEALKEGVTSHQFFRAVSKINSFRGYEKFFRTATVHNPLVFRQGGITAPQATPTGYPISGPPFDIYTPTGVIPGCLNLLCPAPQGALWYAGICWCTP